jgi:hypothetical protein
MRIEVAITPEKTERWIQRSLRKYHPDCEAAYRRAWGAFLRCVECGTVGEPELGLVVAAVRSDRAILWKSAVEWTGQLVAKHAIVQSAVRQLVTDPLSRIRFSGICCVNSSCPREFQLEMILPAINDRASNVRWKAIESASSMQLSEAIPLIAKRGEIEKNVKVGRVIDFELPLLKDGYAAKWIKGGVDITVRDAGGSSSQFVSQAEIDAQGLPAIVERQKAKLANDRITLKYVIA